jgi:complement component 1 Q subcomponent-binding protein, mitochondrial
MNLNHSVDAEIIEDDVNAKSDNPPDSEMKSRPQFEVKLIKGSQTTRFACSYIQDVSPPIGDDSISKIRMN